MTVLPGTRVSDGQLRRLADELADEEVPVLVGVVDEAAVLVELAYALRPRVHEGRVPSYGSIVVPGGHARTWAQATDVPCRLIDVRHLDPSEVRLFADGISTWVLRCPGAVDHLVAFDRPVAEEYLLVSLHASAGGTIVQRHPTGQVRVFGTAGVVRFDGISWIHEPPAVTWLAGLRSSADQAVLARLLRFAVHDLGARRIGATLICRPPHTPVPEKGWDERLAPPPELSILQPGQLAALRHALSQVDGAAVLDDSGTVTHLGVRLVPSFEAEASVAGMGGTRHTSALRYSFDDPEAVVVIVSDDGPVTVCQDGVVVGRAEGKACRPADAGLQ